MLLAALGCGGSSSSFDGGRVAGVVRAPNGDVALRATDGFGVRLARFFLSEAFALTGIEPAANVTVFLELIDPGGSVRRTLTDTETDSGGAYEFALASDEEPASDLIVRAGTGSARMRSFVYAEDIDVDSATEATVRLVLDSGFALGNFSNSDIAGIQAEVDRATEDVAAGDTVADTNGKAEQRARDDEGVVAAIQQAGSS